MISRTELLKGLRGLLNDEEGSTRDLSDLYAAVDCSGPIFCAGLHDGLDVIKRDTAKHIGLIQEMIHYIERSEKNEF